MRVDDALRFNDSPPFVSESELLQYRAAKCRQLAHFAENERAAERLHALANAYEAGASEDNAQRQIAALAPLAIASNIAQNFD